jgi:PhoH-like ATPase
MPSKPATLLAIKDYPKAEPGKSAVRAVAAEQASADVEDLISGEAVPTPKATRARKKAALLAPVPTPSQAAPASKAPAKRAANTDITAKLKEADIEQPHPAKHKPVEINIKSGASRKADSSGAAKVFVL